ETYLTSRTRVPVLDNQCPPFSVRAALRAERRWRDSSPPGGEASRGASARETEFREGRSQTEFGNEEEGHQKGHPLFPRQDDRKASSTRASAWSMRRCSGHRRTPCDARSSGHVRIRWIGSTALTTSRILNSAGFFTSEMPPP